VWYTMEGSYYEGYLYWAELDHPEIPQELKDCINRLKEKDET